MADTLKRTPLFDFHVKLGARMVPFAGWEMPVQYAGVIEEHHNVRKHAGLFDVSHMGEIEFREKGSLEALQHLLSNDLSGLRAGEAQYALLCNERGGIVDDVISYCVAPGKHYLVCVNASNADKDFAWMKERGAKYCHSIENTSSKWAQLALQGPESEKILSQVFSSEAWAKDLSKLVFMKFFPAALSGKPIYVARSGYTGEDGFEIFLPNELAVPVAEKILAGGAKPIGLGARDTLRLEMKYPLHGNDIDEETTPLEAGLGFAVKLGKKEFFPGKDVLEKQKKDGVPRKLIGFAVTSTGIARHGYPVKVDGQKFGEVRSGTQSPTLGKPIGLAYLPTARSAVGNKFAVEIRGKDVDCEVVPTPFVKAGVKR
ncbi:MAG: glycine cleavage system aminomethyltransferase GcvT [Bdellovibrionota bacterium]